MMIELTEREWLLKIAQNETFAVYVYTPLCGTCKVGKQMMDIVLELDSDQLIYQSDIQYMTVPQERFKIESVPCLLLFQEGVLIRKIYALHSVPHLYEATAFLRKQ